jgi:hypothetical protein
MQKSKVIFITAAITFMALLFLEGCDSSKKKNSSGELHLKEKTKDCSDLVYSVFQGDLKAVTEYIKKGGDVNCANSMSQTLLYAAVSKENLSIASSLIENGGNPNIADSHGNTPLHMGCRRINFEMVDLLLKSGANPNVKNQQDVPPLLSGLIRCLSDKEKLPEMVEISKLFFQYKVDVRVGKWGERSMMEVVELIDSPPLTEVFVSHGANLEE